MSFYYFDVCFPIDAYANLLVPVMNNSDVRELRRVLWSTNKPKNRMTDVILFPCIKLRYFLSAFIYPWIWVVLLLRNSRALALFRWVFNNVQFPSASDFSISFASNGDRKIVWNAMHVLNVNVGAVGLKPITLVVNARPIGDECKNILSITSIIYSSDFLARRMCFTRILAAKG